MSEAWLVTNLGSARGTLRPIAGQRRHEAERRRLRDASRSSLRRIAIKRNA